MLKHTIEDYRQLLSADPSTDDPVRARLYPSASLDDPKITKQFHELVHSDLEAHKKHTAQVALSCLDQPRWRGSLSDEQTNAWMVLLADLRLALGVKMGVTEETMEGDPDPADPEQWPLALLHYLGFLQNALIEAVARDLN